MTKVIQNLATCPKCGTSDWEDSSHPFNCPKCNPGPETLGETGFRRSFEETVAEKHTKSQFFSKLHWRYKDAYAVSRGLETTGGIIKIGGLVIGGILLLVGVIFLLSNDGMTGTLEGILFLFAGAMVAGGGFIAGILTAAVGQFMSAAIDTAVNTSESISPDEKAQILGLC